MLDATPGRPRPAQRYLLALLATIVAAGLTYLARPLIAPAVFPLFILAVAVVSIYGGWAAGALTAGLSLAVLSVGFLPPLSLSTPSDLARLGAFVLVALATVAVAGSTYRQRQTALSQAAENERLRRLAVDAAARAESETAVAAAALTQQQHAETALRRSEAELADFFETASTGLHWVDQDGTILLANQAELDLLGYRRDEYVGHDVSEFHVDRPVIDDMLRRIQAGEALHEYPARLRCKDGGIKHVVIDSSGYFEDGNFRHTRCFTRDVTLERQAAEATARLAAIVTSSDDAIVGKTLDGTITSWNAAAERIFGYTAAEMVGASIFKLIPPQHHDAERELLDRLRRGEHVEFSQAERMRKDGRRIWISLSVSPVRDATGAIIGAASIKRDITERKLLQERLTGVQRLEAVGQLAGGIAHEANNQMSVVLGMSHFLLRRADLSDKARADVEQIRLAAERTAGITQQLLAFGRKQMLRLEHVSLNDVVQSIGPVLRRSLTESQELVVRLGLLGGLVRADPRQLEQVLLNLTLNARDAMPEGGRLTIATREVELDREAAQQQGLPEGTYEELEVSDTGRGMDEATLAHMFEPFFTTKEVGEGTGLGLSVVHGIVSQVGGHIRVRSEVGKGTAFRLLFPVAASVGGHHSAVPEEPPRAAPGAVLLVVEDDPGVRAMTARALVDGGYQVLEAGDGQAALELVRRQEGRLDLVVTDIGMAGMDGYQLAARLRAERPALPVVFMTGYGDGRSGERASAGDGPVLQKPFAPEDLLRLVGEALAAPQVS